LTVSTGEMVREMYGHRFFDDNEVLKIELSEVQWARLVASINSHGVPCTIRRCLDETGRYVPVDDPPEHMTDTVKMKTDVEEMAKRVAGNLGHIRALVDDALNGTPTKTKLKEISEWLQQTQQAIDKDMPFLTRCQIEGVEEMVNSAKAEVDAHIQFSLNELGRRALGEEIKKGGVAISVGGRQHRIEKRKDDDDRHGA
jgi:hypothetical protein